MIRPITLICWFLVLGAGLYLYRAKYEVEKMDKRIVQIGRETDGLRADSRRLLDEWIRLGEPEQLHKYSDQYLGLKTVAPAQFTRASDLASRLPPPRAFSEDRPDPTPARPGALPGQTSTPGNTPGNTSWDPSGDTAGTDPDELPVPPVPPALLATQSAEPVPLKTAPPFAARPAEPRPPVSTQPPQTPRVQQTVAPPPQPSPQPGVRNAAQTPADPRPAAPREGQPRPPQTATAPTPAALNPHAPPYAARPSSTSHSSTSPSSTSPSSTPTPTATPAARPPQPQLAARPPVEQSPGQARNPPAAPAASLLGMSRSTVPLPLPAPTPVSTNTWNGAVGGGQ